jgi:hypothetical protein
LNSAPGSWREEKIYEFFLLLFLVLFVYPEGRDEQGAHSLFETLVQTIVPARMG